MTEALKKQPGESRLYTLDFSQFPEIERGAVLTVIDSVAYEVVEGSESSPLVLTGEVINPDQDKVQVRIEDGTHECFYKVTATVQTDDGDVLEGEGYLMVIDL